MRETPPSKDFLSRTWRFAQDMVEIPHRPVIDGFGHEFIGFGSCFALELLNVLDRYGFKHWNHQNICQHFSSLSLANMLEWVSLGHVHTEEELYFFGGDRREVLPYRFFFADRYHGENAVTNALAEMNRLDNQCREAVRRADTISITLGTSRVAILQSTGHLVCRQSGIPIQDCRWEMLSVEDNIRQLERITQSIARIRGGSLPNIFITLSPQRYFFANNLPGCEDVTCQLSDNSLSKSILRVAISSFINKHGGPIEYFPSYEMVLDELRPYDTLENWDHTHVNQLTPMYVVKKFIKAYMAPEITRELHFFDNFAGMIQGIRNPLERGASPDNPRLQASGASIAESLQRLKGLGSDMTRFHPAMDVLQALGLHREAVECFSQEKDLRMRWKVAVSLHHLGRFSEARVIMEDLMALPEAERAARPALMADCAALLDKIESVDVSDSQA